MPFFSLYEYSFPLLNKNHLEKYERKKKLHFKRKNLREVMLITEETPQLRTTD